MYPFRPAVSGLQKERDSLLREYDELRARSEQLETQVKELSSALEMRADSPSASIAGLRASQAASNEVAMLRIDLVRAEDSLAQTEADLDAQTVTITDLMKMVEDLRAKAAVSGRLKDQLDEYQHMADRMQRSENLVEKYRKKLEDTAGLRKQLRSLEEEIAGLSNINAVLEAELKQAGGVSKPSTDEQSILINALEKTSDQQGLQIADLLDQLQSTRTQLNETQTALQRDRVELQLHQERLMELEQGAPTPGLKRRLSSMDLFGKNSTLEEEIVSIDEEEGDVSETKTE